MRNVKEYTLKIGSTVKVRPVEFTFPITGRIRSIYDNIVVVFVDQVQATDQITAVEKNYIAVALIEDIITINEKHLN